MPIDSHRKTEFDLGRVAGTLTAQMMGISAMFRSCKRTGGRYTARTLPTPPAIDRSPLRGLSRLRPEVDFDLSNNLYGPTRFCPSLVPIGLQLAVDACWAIFDHRANTPRIRSRRSFAFGVLFTNVSSCRK